MGGGSWLSFSHPVVRCQILAYTRLLFSLFPLPLSPPSPFPHAVFVYRNEPCVAATAYNDRLDCLTRSEISGVRLQRYADIRCPISMLV